MNNQTTIKCLAVYSDGEKLGFQIKADFDEGGDIIQVRFPQLSKFWDSTTWQVNNANHDRLKAAKLAWDYSTEHFFLADELTGRVDNPVGFELKHPNVHEFRTFKAIVKAAHNGFEGLCWIRTGEFSGKSYNILRNDNVVNIEKLHVPREGDSSWRSVYQNVIGAVS